MTLMVVLATWRQRINTLKTLQLSREAELLEQFAMDVEAAKPDEPEIPLTPAQAAHLSGYCTDHVRRMLASGRWRNVGTPRRPRVYAQDLPRKRRRLDFDCRDVVHRMERTSDDQA